MFCIMYIYSICCYQIGFRVAAQENVIPQVVVIQYIGNDLDV